jgi:hypothetical protein
VQASAVLNVFALYLAWLACASILPWIASTLCKQDGSARCALAGTMLLGTAATFLWLAYVRILLSSVSAEAGYGVATVLSWWLVFGVALPILVIGVHLAFLLLSRDRRWSTEDHARSPLAAFAIGWLGLVTISRWAPESSNLDLLSDIGIVLGSILGWWASYSALLWVAARLTERQGGGRSHTAMLVFLAGCLFIPLWAGLLSRVGPAQIFLGVWWWLFFLALPSIAMISAALAALRFGARRRWSALEHAAAGLLIFAVGLVSISAVINRGSADIYGLSIAASGCGLADGAADWLEGRDQYRRFWRSQWPSQDVPRCAKALDARIRSELGGGVTSPIESP